MVSAASINTTRSEMAYMIIKKLFLLRVEPPSLLLCQRSWAVGRVLIAAHRWKQL